MRRAAYIGLTVAVVCTVLAYAYIQRKLNEPIPALPPPVQVSESPAPTQTSTGKYAFSSTLIADGWGKDYTFTSYLYTANDGTALEYRVLWYRDSSSARREFERIVARASELEAGPDLHECPELRRTVIQLSEGDKVRAAIIWLQGSDVHKIASDSLEHVLDFEAQQKVFPSSRKC